MSEKLVAKIFDMIITTKCTMNCKLCATVVPYIEKPAHTPKEIVAKELEKCFEIYDYAERVELLGGEPLMHPDIVDIVKEILKYKGRFDLIRITTNCTIVPSDELIDIINNSDCKFDFILDDYGKNSVNLNRILELLDKNNISYRLDVYHGEEQRFDGWINFGDFTYKNYTEQELEKVVNNCVGILNAFRVVHNGKLYLCVYAFSGAILGKIQPLKGEYIDLFDETISIEEKREIARKLGTKPVEACKYCNSFNSDNSPRYPAAEQLPKRRGVLPL